LTIRACPGYYKHRKASEKPASPGFFDNKRKKDAAAAAAPKETGGRNEFRHPLKYDFFVSVARSRTPPAEKLFAFCEKDESNEFDFFDKLCLPNQVSRHTAYI
jgi:hypothetical protein